MDNDIVFAIIYIVVKNGLVQETQNVSVLLSSVKEAIYLHWRESSVSSVLSQHVFLQSPRQFA